MIKRTVLRVDASLNMGSGHVMRCLTLADALRAQGGECHFICREHQGNLLEFIRQRGYSVTALPAGPEHFQPGADSAPPVLAHAAWLGCDWALDAEQSRPVLERIQPDWLVVDHYALDARWETALRPYCRKLMVMDDLADRQHLCNVLLDQNLGRKQQDYTGLIPQDCELLLGPQYALLRPEFSALREYSLGRRVQPEFRHILISMGGVDQHNATGEVLALLDACPLPTDVHLTVVMGPHAPWLTDVQVKAGQMPWVTDVLVNTDNMAQLMADADLAIGAAGSTSWERSCLGLPCILLCLADNQKMVTQALASNGAAMVLDMQGMKDDGARLLSEMLIKARASAPLMIESAATITDGSGITRLLGYLLGE